MKTELISIDSHTQEGPGLEGLCSAPLYGLSQGNRKKLPKESAISRLSSRNWLMVPMSEGLKAAPMHRQLRDRDDKRGAGRTWTCGERMSVLGQYEKHALTVQGRPLLCTHHQGVLIHLSLLSSPPDVRARISSPESILCVTCFIQVNKQCS